MNIAVAQSGGPTCAINASLVGVFRESLKEPAIDAIFGSVNGVEGIIQDHLIDLKTMIRTNEDMELLRQTPSTVLGSCRYKLPEIHENPEIFEKCLRKDRSCAETPQDRCVFLHRRERFHGHRTETFRLFQGNRSGRKSHWHSQDDR